MYHLCNDNETRAPSYLRHISIYEMPWRVFFLFVLSGKKTQWTIVRLILRQDDGMYVKHSIYMIYRRDRHPTNPEGQSGVYINILCCSSPCLYGCGCAWKNNSVCTFLKKS